MSLKECEVRCPGFLLSGRWRQVGGDRPAFGSFQQLLHVHFLFFQTVEGRLEFGRVFPVQAHAGVAEVCVHSFLKVVPVRPVKLDEVYLYGNCGNMKNRVQCMSSLSNRKGVFCDLMLQILKADACTTECVVFTWLQEDVSCQDVIQVKISGEILGLLPEPETFTLHHHSEQLNGVIEAGHRDQ